MVSRPSSPVTGPDRSIGGYCKEYTKGKRAVGVMLEDTWLLKSIGFSLPVSLFLTICLQNDD